MSGRTKHILIVTHYYPPHIGGIEMIAFNQARKLAALGHSVTVVTSRIGSKQKKDISEGVRVIRVKAWNFFERWGVPFPIFSPQLWFVLLKIAKTSDIVHVHDAFYESSFLAAIAARWHKKPIVLTQHVALINHSSSIVIAIEKLVYATTGAAIFHFSSVVLTYNQRVEQFLLARGVDRKKLATLVNGVDIDFFHPISMDEKMILRRELGLAVDKKIILFVGRFVHKKGIDKVWAARSPEYQIVCAGGDTPKENFDNVKFLGKLDQSALRRAYQAADIFLLPSDSEGFPVSIQEAMATGLPVITTNDPGYDRYCLDKKQICLLDNPTGLSVQKNIREITNSDEHLTEMGEYSRRYVLDHFSWSVLIAELDKIYDAVLTATSKKKIAIISDSVYPFNKGGKEKRLYDITTHLAARGYDVTIYCMQWWEGDAAIVRDGVTFYAISPYYPLYAGGRRSMKEAIFFALHSFRLFNKTFDIVDVDHMPYMVLFSMKIICLLKGKKMIATWHEVVGLEYWNRYIGSAGIIAYCIEKMSVILPDIIISVSYHTTRNLQNILKTKKKIITIPNGLDIIGIENVTSAATGVDIIFAGRLVGHKNVDVLLRAMDILVKQNADLSLLVVGEGPEKKNLEKLAEELGIERNVSFKDFFEDHDELYGIMHASRVFALPSTREGFGIAVLEANACGLPVVAIDDERNAAGELIVDGENGVLTKLDVAQLASAVEKALNMKKDRQAYYRYAEQYDWSRIVPEIEKIYNL